MQYRALLGRVGTVGKVPTWLIRLKWTGVMKKCCSRVNKAEF